MRLRRAIPSDQRTAIDDLFDLALELNRTQSPRTGHKVLGPIGAALVAKRYSISRALFSELPAAASTQVTKDGSVLYDRSRIKNSAYEGADFIDHPIPVDVKQILTEMVRGGARLDPEAIADFQSEVGGLATLVEAADYTYLYRQSAVELFDREESDGLLGFLRHRIPFGYLDVRVQTCIPTKFRDDLPTIDYLAEIGVEDGWQLRVFAAEVPMVNRLLRERGLARMKGSLGKPRLIEYDDLSGNVPFLTNPFYNLSREATPRFYHSRHHLSYDVDEAAIHVGRNILGIGQWFQFGKFGTQLHLYQKSYDPGDGRNRAYFLLSEPVTFSFDAIRGRSGQPDRSISELDAVWKATKAVLENLGS